MLHFPPEFWRILNFFSSARGKSPILPYPALCCLQYFPRTNDKIPILVPAGCGAPDLLFSITLFHPATAVITSVFFIVLFVFLCGIVLKKFPVSFHLTPVSSPKNCIAPFLQIMQGCAIFPLSDINEVIDFELIDHCGGAHFFHDHSASASSEKDAHVSAADSIHWVKGAITNDGTCQTFSWKKLHYLLL